MKRKRLAILFFILIQMGYSQTKKSLKGMVCSGSQPLQGVEVINLYTQKTALTNNKGEFLIEGRANDSLYFYSKNYDIKKIKITHQLINDNNAMIELMMKPEELNEVVVTKMSAFKWKGNKNWEQQKIDQNTVEKNATKPKTIGVNDGTITNGMDLMRIGKSLISLFSNNKESEKKEASSIVFKDFVKANCYENYFTETLKLKPEEIELFLDYCDADPESKEKSTTKNVLSVMDYLLKKNEAFQKLKEDK